MQIGNIFAIQETTLCSFAIVLGRIGGLFTFLPLPAFQNSAATARIVVALATTIALRSQWPVLQRAPAGVGELGLWMISELGLGLAVGLTVAFLLEMFLFAAQCISVQAGFSYASALDPSSNADSTVLLTAAQLTGALLFFSLGLDGQVLKIIAWTLQNRPPGAAAPALANLQGFVETCGGIFSTGLRLALPIMTLLLLVDLSIALLGRLNGQLQVMSLAMPLKMIAALATLGWLILLMPKIFTQTAGTLFTALQNALRL